MKINSKPRRDAPMVLGHVKKHVPTLTTKIISFGDAKQKMSLYAIILAGCDAVTFLFLFLACYQNERKHIHLTCTWIEVFVPILNLCHVSLVIL